MGDSRRTEARAVLASEEWDVALADRLVAAAGHPSISMRRWYTKGQGQEKNNTPVCCWASSRTRGFAYHPQIGHPQNEHG